MNEMKGRSLRYVRILLGKRAKYPTALYAYQEAVKDDRLSEVFPPPLGAIVWFMGGPTGDIGLHLGNQQVATLTQDGTPCVRIIRKDDEDLLGWSPSTFLG